MRNTLITRKEAARLLGVTADAVMKLEKRGGLTRVPDMGKAVRYRAHDVFALCPTASQWRTSYFPLSQFLASGQPVPRPGYLVIQEALVADVAIGEIEYDSPLMPLVKEAELGTVHGDSVSWYARTNYPPVSHAIPLSQVKYVLVESVKHAVPGVWQTSLVFLVI